MENLNVDQYKNIILSVTDAIEVLLRGNSLDDAYVNDQFEVSQFNTNAELYLESTERIKEPVTVDQSFEQYHKNLSTQWMIPDKYLQIDVQQYVLALTTTPEEKQRVQLEIKMYRERNLEPVLQLIIYLVDFMRKKNIVWGVGRGSSVSSYVLYLIGLHKVNSLKYGLSIEEFLR